MVFGHHGDDGAVGWTSRFEFGHGGEERGVGKEGSVNEGEREREGKRQVDRKRYVETWKKIAQPTTGVNSQSPKCIRMRGRVQSAQSRPEAVRRRPRRPRRSRGRAVRCGRGGKELRRLMRCNTSGAVAGMAWQERGRAETPKWRRSRTDSRRPRREARRPPGEWRRP